MIKFYIIAAATLCFSSAAQKNDMKYDVGQEWKYKTRQGEENSILKILKIEEYPAYGKVIHISVNG